MILCHLLEIDAVSGRLAASGDVEFHDREDVAQTGVSHTT